MFHLPGHAVLAFALLLGAPLEGDGEGAGEASSFDAALESWRARNGPSWRARRAPGSASADLLFGGRTGGREVPESGRSAVLVRHALELVEEASGILGVNPATLVPDGTLLLPLAAVGGTDKVTVRFRQALGGVPVEGGTVNALFTPAGELLSLASTALTRHAEVETDPTLTGRAAEHLALRAWYGNGGAPPTSVMPPRLVVDRLAEGGAGVLVWKIAVRAITPGFPPEGTEFAVAAVGRPRVLAARSLIHHATPAPNVPTDVGGRVQGRTTPGLDPDSAANPTAVEPMKNMMVTSPLGSVTTDDQGDFVFPGVAGPLQVTFRFEGPHNDVSNEAGADYELSVSLSGTGNSVLLNPTPSEGTTAQANAFARIEEQREWVIATNPLDTVMDTVNPASVNNANCCFAFYDETSTYYYSSGCTCPNTAYSTVIWHEMGHWLNDRYGSGNALSGFGEGNADVFAMYLADTPVVGSGFFGPGSIVRTGENTRRFCGDSRLGCYGEAHEDGEVLMGALWKVRRNLQTTHGTSAGGAIADALFNAWMNAYDQATIETVIELQWLCLDDDDGNLGNGTPNHADIDSAFREQGFPGYPPKRVARRAGVPVPVTR